MARVVPKENSEGHLNHHKQAKYLFLKYAQEGCDSIFTRGADFLHFLSSELEVSRLFGSQPRQVLGGNAAIDNLKKIFFYL